MRRTPLRSALAAIMLLWFGLVSAEPALLHACPVHSGVSASHDGIGAGHGEHDAAALAHASHHAASAPATHASPGEEAPEQHRCACIGDCSTGTTATVLPATLATLSPGTEWIARTSIAPDDSAIVTAPAFLRPYANGPPSGHAIA